MSQDSILVRSKRLRYLSILIAHGGKQEWVTDIECIDAAGEALPPLIIFKSAEMNTRWLNERSPEGWHFAISKNGWTSNDLGLLAWLKEIFCSARRDVDYSSLMDMEAIFALISLCTAWSILSTS
jgi:hypothetical protein